jgi:hypothetical protein
MLNGILFSHSVFLIIFLKLKIRFKLNIGHWFLKYLVILLTFRDKHLMLK